MSKRGSLEMSCTVMYQPYLGTSSSTSSYGGGGGGDRPPPEKKAFRFPYVPSPPDSLHSEGSSYSHSSPQPSVVNSPRRPLTPSFPPSSAPATVTSGSLRSPRSHSHHHHSSSSSAASATITNSLGVEDPSGGGERVQYLSANCVVYENYREDTGRVVEEHFNRALSAPSSSSAKCLPMSTRNFPASFWNSNYQPQLLPSKSSSFMGAAYGAGADFYGAAVGDYGTTLSGLHQSDPWHYPLTSHHHHPHHHQGYHRATDLSYPTIPSTSRFNAAQYGSFFLAGAAAATNSTSRFAGSQCSSKDATTTAWPSSLYHPHSVPHPHEALSELNLADYAAHYTSSTRAQAGLETTPSGVEAKDPYWF